MNKTGIRKPTFTELVYTLEDLEGKLWMTPSGKNSRSLEKTIDRLQKLVDDWEHDEAVCKYGQVKKTPTGDKIINECKCEPKED